MENLGANFQVVQQKNSTTKCSNAAEQRNVRTDQIVKSLIVRSDDRNLHLCIPGDAEVDEKKVFGHVTMVDENQAKKLSGFEPGKIHPFSTDLKHLVDFRILENKKVSFTTGKPDEGIIIQTEEFVEALETDDFEYVEADIVHQEENKLEAVKSDSLTDEEQEFVMNSGLANHFIALKEDYDDGAVLEVIEKLNRKDHYAPRKVLEQILENSQNKNQIKILLERYIENGEVPELEGSNESASDLVEEIIEKNPQAEKDLKKGNESAVNFVIGKAMEKTQGQADPEKIENVVKNEFLET